MDNDDGAMDLPAEVIGWLGQVVVVDEGAVPVEQGAIENFCIAVGDANPLYWDPALAVAITGGSTAPSALVSAWARPHVWSPARETTSRPLELHFRLKELLGLPKAVVIESESCHYQPARLGDRVRAEQVLDAVGAMRDGRLGRGRRWTISVHYRNQADVLLASERLSFFAYGAAGAVRP